MSRHTSPPGSGDGIVAGQINAPKVAGQPLPHVRFGSLADITSRLIHVRFTPKSGHSLARLLVGLDASNT